MFEANYSVVQGDGDTPSREFRSKVDVAVDFEVVLSFMVPQNGDYAARLASQTAALLNQATPDEIIHFAHNLTVAAMRKERVQARYEGPT